MSTLTQKHCVPCEGGIPPMPREEAEKLMAEIPEWKLAEDGLSIHRQFRFGDFAEALGFVNLVGDLAELEGHHPDITIRWNKVDVLLSTHAIKGLSENDFILAAKIDQL